MAILEMPDDVSAAALSMALLASGVFKKIITHSTDDLGRWCGSHEKSKESSLSALQLMVEFYLDRSS